MATGIVLGGGGTLGDFQVGALKYLYEKGILPDIACVCGTSIGAINAAIVATGEGCDAKLEKYWVKDVKTRVDLIPQHEWSENIAPVLNTIVDGSAGSWVSATTKLIRASGEDALADVWSGIRDLKKMFSCVRNKRALYSPELLEEKMRDDFQDVEAALKSKIALRMYATNLGTGAQTCFYNTSCDTDLDEANKGKKVNSLCESKEKLIKAALASAAIPVIFPPVEVDDNWYVDGSMREVVPVQGAIDCGASIIYAILCFPRLTQSGEDGIIDSQTEDFSTSSLFDIRTDDFGTSEKDWSSGGASDVLDIANRTAAIVLDQITSGDLKATSRRNPPATLTVIAPLIPVHGMAELNKGLLTINTDQGYMRAFDEVDAPDKRRDRCRQLTGEITSRRVAIWKNEHELIRQWAETEDSPSEGFFPLPRFHVRRIIRDWLDTGRVNTGILHTIRQQKRELKPFVLERLKIAGSPHALPDNYEDMYLKWEPHDLKYEMRDIPLPPSPWDRLDLGCNGSEVILNEAPP